MPKTIKLVNIKNKHQAGKRNEAVKKCEKNEFKSPRYA